MGMTKADAIRPFSIHVPDEALVDLRRRINATRWPERETVTDASAPKRRPLRGLGAARSLRSGAARGVQILAVAGNQ